MKTKIEITHEIGALFNLFEDTKRGEWNLQQRDDKDKSADRYTPETLGAIEANRVAFNTLSRALADADVPTFGSNTMFDRYARWYYIQFNPNYSEYHQKSYASTCEELRRKLTARYVKYHVERERAKEEQRLEAARPVNVYAKLQHRVEYYAGFTYEQKCNAFVGGFGLWYRHSRAAEYEAEQYLLAHPEVSVKPDYVFVTDETGARALVRVGGGE